MWGKSSLDAAVIGYDIYFRDDTFNRTFTRFVEWGEPTELGEVFTQSGYRITGWVQTEGEELRLYTPDEVITLTRSDLPSGELHLQAMWRETGGTAVTPRSRRISEINSSKTACRTPRHVLDAPFDRPLNRHVPLVKRALAC
ncbi:MAG: hypothetical protein IJU78_04450 [Clostridia bacterium]|nr:hypothetical protein [Clostridia bacterium]